MKLQENTSIVWVPWLFNAMNIAAISDATDVAFKVINYVSFHTWMCPAHNYENYENVNSAYLTLFKSKYIIK